VNNTINARRIARWDGVQWHPMGTGFTGGLTAVHSMAVYNNELYVGGYFSSSDGVAAQNICKWNGAFWSPIGIGANGGVRTMFVDTTSNKLYVGGEFTQMDTTATPSTVACFDGISWMAIGNGPQLWARDLDIYNNKLIAAGGSYGLVNSFGDTIKEIAWFNGSDWAPLCEEIYPIGTLYALKTYNNVLYLGGAVDSIDGVSVYHIARFNNPTLTYNELPNKCNVKIYPNPTSSLLTIEHLLPRELEEIVLEVHDVMGRLCFTEKIDLNRQTTSLDLTSYMTGIYFVAVYVDNKLCIKEKLVLLEEK
jgi:hypothetical protein